MIYTIDANIGAGKSTVLAYLHNHYRIPVDLEPIAKWQPFLDDIYTKHKGAFEFQVRVWLDRCWIQQRPNMAPMVMERSPFFQSNVFLPANLDGGSFSLQEYQMLQEMYQKSMVLWSPQAYIYLRSDPLRCHERIMKRARLSEDTISIEYLQKLHDYHERAYMIAASQGTPIICIHVENKSVKQIAEEILQALIVMGYPSPHNNIFAAPSKANNSAS